MSCFLTLTSPLQSSFPMEFQNSHFTNPSFHRDPETAFYTALWHACAGPLVRVPREGQRVFYFPQGHLDQVQASTDQVIEPMYNLPSKIPCRVINVQLKADPDTDELFAQVTLLPEPTQDEKSVEMEGPIPPSPESPGVSFCETLTLSNTNISGGCSVLERHANQCFPPLDMSIQTPNQEFVAKDLQGNEWRFEHVFKGMAGQPRRHFLIGGWRDFVSSKRLVVGDAFVFLRGENGELGIGIRRAMRPNGNASSTSSKDYLLANAWEAYTTRTILAVYYKPRRCAAEFIVPFDQYMESMRKKYSIGMRFQMRFENEEALEQRFNGSIVGIENADPRWMGSKWRCLKVRWDQNETSTTHLPERVSAWQLEPDMAPLH